jgi:hypothetical protein
LFRCWIGHCQELWNTRRRCKDTLTHFFDCDVPLFRRICVVTGLALFTFWAGLSLGYHEGVNNEQRAWFSTAQVERTDQGDSKIVYTFPHTRVSVNWLGRAAANRPDPRSYKKYGHFEP